MRLGSRRERSARERADDIGGSGQLTRSGPIDPEGLRRRHSRLPVSPLARRQGARRAQVRPRRGLRQTVRALVGTLTDLYKERHVLAKGLGTLAPASINRTLGISRHILNWAVGREYLDPTPFRRGTEVLIGMEREDNKRRRRISDQEEAALLAIAPSHLRSMLIVALDTGMRRGEMLALRFGDIDWARQLITLRGPTTKSRRTRVIPIGTARLRAVLEWLRLDGGGGLKADHVRVFSDEAGEPLKCFKKAWAAAVLRAHGITPHWRKPSYKDLTPECQRRFREINLHWHDTRHEYASRLVERGVPLGINF